jgi:hypothetical protein
MRVSVGYACSFVHGAELPQAPWNLSNFKVTVSAGTLDDPNWVKIERVIWTRSALPWMTYPPGIEQFEKAAMG